MPRRRRPPRRSAYQVAPGTTRRRWRRRVHWELLGCGVRGHVLVGTDAAAVDPEDAALVRQADGLRWHRCLRCDTWSALPPPERPRRERAPTRDQIRLPLRGRPLRNRIVLRLIAVEKSLHVLVFAALAVAVFLFTAHRHRLQGDYQRFLTAIGLDTGTGGHHGLWSLVDRAFTVPRLELIGVGAALAVYALVLLAEIVGLWRARRWAEYLAFVETLALVPLEVRELLVGVTALKVASLAVNLAIVAWLVIAHRLFGLRGGEAALRAAEDADSGWPAIERATPPAPRSPVVAASFDREGVG